MRLALRRTVEVFLTGAAVVATALAISPPALAQADADRATARALGNDGSQALDSGDYKTAEDRFRRADRLVHAPTLMLGLARALAGEGKLVEATETYNRIVREGVAPGAPEPFKRALAYAKKEVDDVAPKIGSVTIVVQSAGGAEVPNARAILDGAQLNSASLGVRRLMDPGAHTLRVAGDGFKSAELHFTVPEGGSVNQPVTLEREPSAAPQPAAAPGSDQGRGANLAPSHGSGAAEPPPGQVPSQAAPVASHSRSALPWVALGVGGAGLAVGAVTGLLAIAKHSELKNDCPMNNACPLDKQGDVDAYRAMATVSTVGFVVGGVGVAAGVVLLLAQPKNESGTNPPANADHALGVVGLRVRPFVGPGSIGVVGQF